MQVVIDIDEEIYKTLKNNELSASGKTFVSKILAVATAVVNGTVLPKGHGRLVDADVLDNGLREQQKSYEHTFGARQLMNEAVRDGIIIARTHIKYTPIIIEADRGKGQK